MESNYTIRSLYMPYSGTERLSPSTSNSMRHNSSIITTKSVIQTQLTPYCLYNILFSRTERLSSSASNSMNIVSAHNYHKAVKWNRIILFEIYIYLTRGRRDSARQRQTR